MTAITKERIELFIKNPLENRLTRGEQMELARIAMASLDAEPVRYLNKFSGVCVTLEQQPNASDDVAVYMPLYAAPPVQETGIYKDMLNIISLLEKNEWAEHCTSTVLGSLLESEITRLVSKEQPTPVVPDDWVMVPKTATPEISQAINKVGQHCTCGNCSQRLWDMLLAAAQKPETGPCTK
ncbi:hypothetical protein FNI87_24260 [Salmonella enterica subsp. salamae]|nr:hypothetical protein [Salmonella enterica subsp. salamae serovar Sofia]